jgi:hypothetical protein
VIRSNLAIELTSVAGLAAAVARNAEDTVYAELVEQAALLEPVSVAVSLLNNLQAIAMESEHSDRSTIADRAADRAQERVAAHSWDSVEAWDNNLLHCRALLGMLVRQSSVEDVRAMVTRVLPSTTPGHVLLGIASWSEEVPLFDNSFQGPGRPVPTVRELPDWLPAIDLASAVRTQWPDLADSDLDSADLERQLAAQFIALLASE